jgi:hypothetical protein
MYNFTLFFCNSVYCGAVSSHSFVRRRVRVCPQVCQSGAIPLRASGGCFGLCALSSLRRLSIGMKKALQLFQESCKANW